MNDESPVIYKCISLLSGAAQWRKPAEYKHILYMTMKSSFAFQKWYYSTGLLQSYERIRRYNR